MESSQSISLIALSSELQQLCVEVRSDSQTARYKAIERLDNILSSRKSEVKECISSLDYGKHISWVILFNNAFDGLIKHAVKLEESKNLKSFSTLKNKNYLFSTVINKIIENAIEAKMPIKCGLLVEAATNGIENNIVLEYFSTLLFQIIEKGVVIVDGHLAGVKTSDLNTLLRQCLQCYNENETENGKTLSLLRCINKILDHSSKYSLISVTLPEHLALFDNICISRTSDKSIQQEIIKLLHQYVCNVVVDCHEEIANLLQKVMHTICGYYDFRMKTSYKELFFELCSFLIGIHYLEEDNFNTSVPIMNIDDWKTLLRKIFNIVKTEIKEKSHELNKNSSHTHSEHFLLLASMASYMFFWNPLFDASTNEGQRKVAKMSSKFQGIMDLALPAGDRVNWGWFTVLSECTARYYRQIDETDFQPMLQLITHFQKSASSQSQVKSLTKFCTAILHKEREFEGNAYLKTDFCNEKWKEIVNLATNQLLQNSLLHDELQKLVQYFVQFKKLPVESLVSLIASFTKNTSFRTNSSLATILIAVTSYKQQLLNHKEMIKDLLFWLYPLTVNIDVKSMLNNKSTDPQLMAAIAASIIVENDECVESSSLNFPSNDSLSRNYDLIRTNLMYNYLKKIIFVDITWNKLKRNTSIEKQKLTVNENYLKILLTTIDFDPQLIAQKDYSDLINNMKKLETIIAILERFFERGKFDKNDIYLSALIKKATFLLNTIELQLGKGNIKMEIANAKDMLCLLERITERLNIRNLNSIIKTSDNQSIIRHLLKSIAWLTNENNIDEVEDIAFHRKLALHCIKVLAICEISEESFAFIDDFEFNVNQESEVESLLSIIEVFCKQKQCLCVAKWMISIIQDICKNHHENFKLSLDLIRLLPAIATYIKPFEKFTENIIIILSSFLKKSYKKIYPPHFVSELLLVIRDIAKIYCELINDDDLTPIYESITKFLSFPSKTIQYAVVDCFIHLIHDKWLFENVETIPFRHACLCNALFEAIDTLDVNAQSDPKNYIHPVVLQLLLASFSLNYNLEEKALSRLIRNGFFCRKDSNQILKMIGKFLNRDMLSVFKHNIFFILLEWFQIKDCQIRDLKNPLWVAFADDEMELLLKNRSVFEFCALYCDCEMLRKLTNRINADLQGELKNTLPICGAILLPYFSDHSLNTCLYGCNPTKLMVNLRGYKVEFNLKMIATDSVWIVLYHLMRNVWDSRKFYEFCGFSMLWPKTNTINYENFVALVKNFLSSRFSNQKGILDGLLTKNPIQIIRLLTAIKIDYENSYCIESRLHSFFIYCVALSCIKASLEMSENQKLNKVGSFLIRNAIYYLCNIIKNTEDCHLTIKVALNFLFGFTKALLTTHSTCIEETLNLLVRTLVTCASKELSVGITAKCIELLNALICENNNISTKSIAILDDFPADEEYKNLREAHEEIKYKRQTRSLLDEINYFLEIEGRGITGFQKLRKCLAEKKEELHSLCSFINKSPEEIKKGPIFKLLKVLLTSVKRKTANVSKEAALCLGEIGPINLTTFALFSDMKEVCYRKFISNEESLEYFVSQIILSAEHLLFTAKCTKVSLCVEICEHFVNSKVGKKCLATSPLLEIFGENFDNKLSVMSNENHVSFIRLLATSLNTDYENWIVSFTSQIYANVSNSSISALAAIDSNFCEQTLIAYIKLLLLSEDNLYLKSIEQLINDYFEEVYKTLNNPKVSNTISIYVDKAIVKYFLNIAECIRVHNQISKIQLSINYLHIARACVYCEAYFMGLLYLELSKSPTESKRILEDEDFQFIARKAFTCIGYLDAMSGFLNPINSRLEYLSLQNNWHVVLLELDAVQKNNDSSTYERCLRQNGLYSLATTLDPKQQDYEVLWRLGNWDVSKNNSTELSFDDQKVLEKNFQMQHYLALKSIKKIEEENVISAIESARQSVIQILSLVSSECAQSIYKYITWLQMMQQIEDFCELQFSRLNGHSNVLEKWDVASDMEYGHFDFKEQSISQKVTLFDIAGVRANRKIKEYYKGDNISGELLLKLITECKSTGNKNLIIRNITKLLNMNISNELKTKVLIEDADINWKMGNVMMAKAILYNIAKSDVYAFCFKKVDALRIYGKYLAESNSESFNTIHRRFFLSALKLWDNFTQMKDSIAEKHPNVLKDYARYSYEARKNIYKSIAKYADREYTQLNAHINSEDFQLKIKLMGKNKVDANSIREAKRYKTNRDELCTLNILAQNVGIDDHEIKTIDGKRTEYLLLALENYAQYCTYDKSIKTMEIFRIISMWFSNKESNFVLEKLKNCIQNVPSYKFICVLIQLAARIGSGEPEFNDILQSLLEKCCIDHPHHTLPYVLAIAYASMDSTSSTSRSSPRINVAKSIMNEVSKHAAVGQIVNQMQKSSKALIEFANKESKECVHSTLSDNVRRLKNLDQVQCHTLDLPISVNSEYNITSIVKWKEKFTFVGGINAPKKITCLCSDGIERIQLLKGKDDLRQDAIMQQIFGIVNDMLIDNLETRKRKMRIRTYKVVPFSMRSGILEWCENTLPLGVYLTGEKKNGGAHKKYRPDDFPPEKCFKLLLEKHRATPDERVNVFKHVCENFKPVFHYFFLENFLNPEVWFEKRLAYTNSVAINSMVGYILGLGDRHVQNILIDQNTAEVIHIDFGIAFEQGKVMPTPETVPFRLTRDIVAPFGVCGVEGIFRKSCEKMMEVLRENQSVMMTVLEVLVYDPLYIWIVKRKENNEKVEPEENVDKEQKNATAHRALIRVKAKLMGMEDIGSSMNSVEGQVQKLIKQAMDDRNLSFLYPGWNPHL